MHGVDIVSGSGYLDKIIYIDISPGSDLIGSIIAACEKHSIESGLIVHCIGSLQCVYFESIAVDPKYPTGGGITSPRTIEGPIQVLGGQGSVILDETQKYSVHLHITFIEGRTGTIFGGHIEKGNNLALNRLEVGIASIDKMILKRQFDSRTGHYHIVPSTF
jgi:hypothetical protein